MDIDLYFENLNNFGLTPKACALQTKKIYSTAY